MSDALKQLDHHLENQPKNPLRNHQVEEYLSEKSRLESMANAPTYVAGVDRGGAMKKAREIEKMLDAQAAKPLHGEKKDTVKRLADEVMDTVIRGALLPREEMRRNPAGAVGKFIRVENSKPIQAAIQTWKRAQLALEPDNPDPDLANVERFRPEMIHATGGVGTFMPGAQIPGNFAMTPQAKANWPLGEPTAETALQQVQKRERTQAQKDALARAQAAAKAKRTPQV